jgi:hypothetical protein
MPHSRAMPASHVAYPDLNPDRIEQEIFRAYVQLAVEPNSGEASRTVTLARFSGLEISLTEISGYEISGLPAFWLELRSQTTGVAIDSLGFREFDEDEVAAAVAFIQDADKRLKTLH